MTPDREALTHEQAVARVARPEEMKHGGRKTRIKDYQRSKHRKIAAANRKKRGKKQWGENS
jgi:hypothetical protein